MCYFLWEINKQVSGVEINQDIRGSSASEVGVKMNCSPKHQCSGISLEDLMLTYQTKQALASCNHVGGIVSGLVQPNNCF